MNLNKGDHIKVSRGMYYHHGIYIGNFRVIHYSNDESKFKRCITNSSLEEFCCGGAVSVVRHKSVFSADDIAKRALSKLGELGYNVFSNNCEHFCRWCTENRPKSNQVRWGVGMVCGAYVLHLACKQRIKNLKS